MNSADEEADLLALIAALNAALQQEREEADAEARAFLWQVMLDMEMQR